MNLPTAYEFSWKYRYELESGISNYWEKVLISYAQMHVEAALKEASEKAEYHTDGQEHIEKVWIDKDSILNAYPLQNIK